MVNVLHAPGIQQLGGGLGLLKYKKIYIGHVNMQHLHKTVPLSGLRFIITALEGLVSKNNVNNYI